MKIINVVKTISFLVLYFTIPQTSYAQFSGGIGGGNVFNDLKPSKTTLFNLPGNYSQTQFHFNGTTVDYADQYMDGIKYLMASITDAAGNNELDSLTVGISVHANNQFNGTSRYFVPRSYQITPVSNGPASVTLYYSQADFNAYNLAALYHEKLPVNAADSLNNKANLRLYRSSTNSEAANLVSVANPVLQWNAIDSFWVLTFNIADSVKGSYFVSSPFLSNKMVTGISHQSATPTICQTTASTTISWNAVSGAQDYRMRFRPQGSSNWNVSTVATNSRILANLSFNTTYEIQLRVRESVTHQGEYTSIYTFTTPSAPAYPACSSPATISNQVVDGTSAIITWNSVVNGATYGIEMKLASGVTWGGTSITDTTYTLSNLTPNTTYNYRVRTYCTPGATCASSSSYTAVGSFTTLASGALPVCLPPTNLTANQLASNSATLSWTAANNAQAYFVQIKPASSAVWGGSSTVTNARTFNNLLPNTAYNYRVRTTCQVGTTSNSNSAFTSVGTFTTTPLPGNALFGATEAGSFVYPNPTSNELHVSFYTTETTPVYCQLFDLTGRQLKTILMEPALGNNLLDLTIAEFVPGMYTLKVVQNNMPILIERIQKQ